MDTNFEHSLFVTAFGVAAKAHEGGKIKGRNTPYIGHPMGVASLVLANGGSMELAAAALLHDVVEDCDFPIEQIETLFGANVRKYVAAVTNPPIDWGKHTADEVRTKLENFRADYMTRILTECMEIQLLSACDKLSNAMMILEDLREATPMSYTKVNAIWDRYRGKRHGTLTYYEKLADRFKHSTYPNVQKVGVNLQYVTDEMRTKY